MFIIHLRLHLTAAAVLCGLVCGTPVAARVLDVGPNHALKLPSEAAAVAKPGDTVRIEPGEYTDCAVWRAARLTIEGEGQGATLADRTCQGKGIFVIQGDDSTVRNLTFARARVADRNGAGIRDEAANLTVVRSRFVDNENGILAGLAARGSIRILDSEFRGNGKCELSCAHGVYVGKGRVTLLDIEHSRFLDQHVGHHIKSRAAKTIVIDNDIADGPQGNSSYLIDIPNGGDVLIERNRLEKGPRSENASTAISIGAEGVTHPTHQLIVRDNSFTSDLPESTIFVRNGTETPALLSGNRLIGKTIPLEGPGSVRP